MEVAAVIEAFPRVLLMEDLKRRLEVCIERLAFWSPRSIASQVPPPPMPTPSVSVRSLS